ncbi:MAG: thiamine phosphate synthase [Nitrospirota bacterium]|nr:thiamine phosphate synthase [Nitrospirota bacterium]
MTAHRDPRVFSSPTLAGFYLILDEYWASRCSLVEVLRQAGEAGVKLVQYRNKTGSMKQAYLTAHALRRVAAELAIAFIVNDRCDLALAVEADGVHLGQTDLPLLLARKVVGNKMLIGISTHNPEQVRMATEEGADYLGFGPIFSTGTKANLDPLVGIEGVFGVRGLTTLPIFAIGGITPDSVPALHAAGANGVAVASTILDAVDRPRMFAQFMAPFQ